MLLHLLIFVHFSFLLQFLLFLTIKVNLLHNVKHIFKQGINFNQNKYKLQSHKFDLKKSAMQLASSKVHNIIRLERIIQNNSETKLQHCFTHNK